MNIVVYCGSTLGNNEKFAEGAKLLGEWIAAHGHTLVYGGAKGGLMGLVADAVLGNGGEVIGVLPNVESIQKRRHPSLTQYIDTKDMAERKAKMIELADAYVALPGGPGTLDEITDVISLARLGIDTNPCVLYDIDGYYQTLGQFFDQMVATEFTNTEDFKHVLVSEDLEEIGAFLEEK